MPKTKTLKKKITKAIDAPSLMPKFSVTLTLGNQTYRGEGETAIDALQAVPKPVKLSGKGVFFMTDGERKTREVLMYPVRLRRLFYGKLSQQIQLKSLTMGMK